MGIAFRGRPLPHTPEWDAKRIAAVKLAHKEGRAKLAWKGKRRPIQHIQPMLDALAKWRADHPEECRRLSIQNLPKSINGSNNGNWRGGKTQQSKNFRIRNYIRFKKWRLSVLERDGNKCKECGTGSKLDAHHIIPISELPSAAFLRMNGVTLCRKCHVKTDSYGGRKGRNALAVNRLVTIVSIPEHWHDYPTCGNYQEAEDGSVVIFVSEMRSQKSMLLVAVHELVEWILVKNRKISLKSIDDFDIDFENARKPGDESEPGDSPEAPYHDAHTFSTAIERMMCEALRLSWKEHDSVVNESLE